MRVAANFGTMFPGIPLLEKYEKAAKLGFKLIECPFPYSIEADVIKREADKYGLQHSLINAPPGEFEAGERGLAAIASAKDRYLESLELAVKYAKVLGATRIHLMAGLTSDPSAHKIYVENVRIAAERFTKDGILCLIEPINNYSVPGYFLHDFDQALRIIDEVKHPNVKIMYDVFHIQQIHGQLSALAKKHASHIGHIQIAQVPKRDEPHRPGEIDYEYVFNMLKEVNPAWLIGAEYVNTSETEESSSWVKKFGLEF